MPDFNRIKYPYRHSMRIVYKGNETIEILPHLGNYPEFKPLKETGGLEMVTKSVLYFIERGKVPIHGEVRIDAQRYYSDSHIGIDWYFESFSKKGILCVAQEEVEIITMETRKRRDNCIQAWRIYPNEMLIMSDGENTMQRFKHFSIEPNGHLDLLTFVY
jgi:hypothetical protein